MILTIVLNMKPPTDEKNERMICMRKTISLLTAAAIAGSMGVTAIAADTNEPLTAVPSSLVIAETTLQVAVNGEFVTADTYISNDGIMVPVRAVAEALGFQVTWHSDQTLNLNNGDMQCDFAIGKNNYIVYTANPDLIGMSAPFALEAAPELKDATTYVPVSLFVPLFGNDPATVAIDGNTVNISPEAASADDVQIPSPLTEHATLAALEQAVGFSIQEPAVPDGYTASEWTDINQSIAQITYQNGNQVIVYRVSKDTSDISGSYEDYSNKCTLEIEGVTVQLRGEETFHVAVWNDNGSAYSVYAPACLTAAQISQIVTSTLQA